LGLRWSFLGLVGARLGEGMIEDDGYEKKKGWGNVLELNTLLARPSVAKLLEPRCI
jgi:hypothetical protein